MKSWKPRLPALVFVALAVYAGSWVGWKLDWNWLATLDSSALDAAHRIGVEHHGWVIWWNVLCTVFSPVTFRLLTFGLVVVELLCRRMRMALFLFASVELSAVLTETAKRLADRPRPATAMVHAAGTSFPSGHAVGTLVAVLALAVVVTPHLRRSWWPWATAAAVLIVVLVGVGRVALNVHHPSDVVAGWALGYAYFRLTLLILRPTPVTPSDERLEAPGISPGS